MCGRFVITGDPFGIGFKDNFNITPGTKIPIKTLDSDGELMVTFGDLDFGDVAFGELVFGDFAFGEMGFCDVFALGFEIFTERTVTGDIDRGFGLAI